jgi:hypothetical protein
MTTKRNETTIDEGKLNAFIGQMLKLRLEPSGPRVRL